jgi:hypothetical protein
MKNVPYRSTTLASDWMGSPHIIDYAIAMSCPTSTSRPRRRVLAASREGDVRFRDRMGWLVKKWTRFDR